MDTAQWPQQGIGVVNGVDRKRPYKEQALNCPRCNSTNTKFCYYNNYSLSQPRYFCKTCRRYWTEGGSLRNVPVGGGSRKNKKSSSSFTSSLASTSTTPATIITTSSSLPSSTNLHHPYELNIPPIHLASSKFDHGGHNLNLSYPKQNLGHEFGGLPSASSLPASAGGGSLSAVELLRSGISARGLSSPAAPSGSIFAANFVGYQELMRPSSVKLQFDGVDGSGYGRSMHEVLEVGGGRLLLPFEDLKQVPTPTRNASHGDLANGVGQGQGDPTLFWNDIMGNHGGGGGGSW